MKKTLALALLSVLLAVPAAAQDPKAEVAALKPKDFPVGARVCSNVATTNVAVNWIWDSANANVNLRPGSLSTITLPAIGAGVCADAYFEIEVNQVAAAYDMIHRTDPAAMVTTNVSYGAVLNGILGDYLASTGNPLAIPIELRVGGRPLPLERAPLKKALPRATGKLLVLLHGSSMNDLQWERNGHDHGNSDRDGLAQAGIRM